MNILYLRRLVTCLIFVVLPLLALAEDPSDINVNLNFEQSPERLEQIRLQNEVLRRKLEDDDKKRAVDLQAARIRNPEVAAEIDRLNQQTEATMAEVHRLEAKNARFFGKINYYETILKIVSFRKVGEGTFEATHDNGLHSSCAFTSVNGNKFLKCKVPFPEGTVDYNCFNSPSPLLQNTVDFGLGYMMCNVDVAALVKLTMIEREQ